MDVLTIIASLCHLAVGGMGVDPKKVDEAQLKCQQYYLICAVQKNPKSDAITHQDLAHCILERKI